MAWDLGRVYIAVADERLHVVLTILDTVWGESGRERQRLRVGR